MNETPVTQILRKSTTRLNKYPFPLEKLTADLGWTFANLTTLDTTYVSHGYHRYPAKFIPQLSRKLIERYSRKGELINDPFMGSGTTMLEGLLAARRVLGTDINPVATLISQAKLRPFEPDELEERARILLREIKLQVDEEVHDQLPLEENKTRLAYSVPELARICYWFPAYSTRAELAIILTHIYHIEDERMRTFCLCAFSQILKNTSIWLNKSTKPTRDLNKKPTEPFKVFQRHFRKMLRRNRKLYFEMDPLVFERLDEYAVAIRGDARTQPTREGSVSLIVTSPPYVTSYEYADLHQLSALWLEYARSVNQFRGNFIGSAYKSRTDNSLLSPIAEQTIKKLAEKSPRMAASVQSYFIEMQECFFEMRRVLKTGGKTAIVIGNTALKGVPILNAEIFVETLEALDLKTYDIIKRMIPSKILPQTRDKKTGRFTSKKSSDAYAYPHEFIIIMEKR